MAPGISQLARIVAAVLPDSFQVAVHEFVGKNSICAVYARLPVDLRRLLDESAGSE